MTNNLINKLRSVPEQFSLDTHSMKFKRFLAKNVSLPRTASTTRFLIEFEQSPENVVALSLFLPMYRESSSANFAAFQMVRMKKSKLLVNKIRYRFSTTATLVGTSFFQITSNKRTYKNYSDLFQRLIHSKRDLETFTYLNIQVGDLIYDEYLAKYSLPTVDLEDARLSELFGQALGALDWWREFEKENCIEGVVVSHDVYLYGIAARYFISRNIPVYLVSSSAICKLTPENPNVNSRVSKYPKEFSKLDPTVQADGIRLAKVRLTNRFKGVGDLYYMPLSAFSETAGVPAVISKSNRKKVLVAAHDFYDSPHGGYIHFYPDFYEWMERLGAIAGETNYDWYIKTHPFLRGRGREILSEFAKKNNNFTLLPSNVTHNQIVAEGIDVALTVYGTIATEYPLLGVPVLNASAKNPHRAYNFSITPSDANEYEHLIRNIELIPRISNLDQIYEYYFMHHLVPIKNWIFSSDEKYKLDTGYGLNPMTRYFYTYYLTSSNVIRTSKVHTAIRNYLNSDDYFLGHHHFEQAQEFD
jgi:hypothetical protein